MAHDFCPGYTGAYRTLVRTCPGTEVFPQDAFRTEWGPIFHRGRLNGTARVLVIGQDPAAHEAIARRILVGVAGQRAQGLLRKLGIDRRYVFVNAFVYSVYGQDAGDAHVADPGITAYRNAWLDRIAAGNDIAAVLALGGLADEAYHLWPGSAGAAWTYRKVYHPTYPDSAGGTDAQRAQAMKRLCDSWNDAIDAIRAGGLTQDVATPVSHYGAALTEADLAPIPERDLPPGLPAWMRDVEPWAARTGTGEAKRRTITVTAPPGAIA